MTLQIFTAGQTLTAGQMNTLQHSVYNFTLSTISSSTYTLVSGDVGKLLIFTNNANPVEVTVPENFSISNGDTIEIVHAGTGSLQLIADGSVVLNSEGGLLTLENQYSRISLTKISTNDYIVSWLTSITTAEIQNAAVTTNKIDDAAVTTEKIDDMAVTTAKLDNNLSFSGTTSFAQVIETAITDSTTVLSSTTTHINVLSGSVYRFTSTSHEDGFKINIRGNGSTTLNSLMTANTEAITLVISVKSGASAVSFSNLASYLTIDTTATVTKYWFGGVKFGGNANSEDYYTITIFKTAENQFSAFISQSKFAIPA